MQENKAVIPIAGLGTRLLPTVKAPSKKIVLVISARKNAIENHFDASLELKTQLERRHKQQLLVYVRSIIPEDVSIVSFRQAEAKGLGHATACAHPVVDEHKLLLVLRMKS